MCGIFLSEPQVHIIFIFFGQKKNYEMIKNRPQFRAKNSWIFQKNLNLVGLSLNLDGRFLPE